MYGKGIITGLKITAGHFFRHFRGGYVTEFYPEVMPKLPDRFHGSFTLYANKCIVCMLCANACPNSVIKITGEKNENNKKQLTGYKMFTERCLYCGLCVEACPTNAITFNQDFETATYTRDKVNLDMLAIQPPGQDEISPNHEKLPAESRVDS